MNRKIKQLVITTTKGKIITIGMALLVGIIIIVVVQHTQDIPMEKAAVVQAKVNTVGNSVNKLNSDKKHDLILLRLDEKGFKEECHDVSYENLLNKFAYYSQSKTTCKVKVTDFDVNEKGYLYMSVQMVNTPAKYTGNMYLTYTGTDTKLNKIKRGDILTVWGRADGMGLSYSKKTPAVKLPKMNVGYITIK